MKAPRLTIVTTLWRRHAIERAALLQWREAAEAAEVDLRIVAAGSEGSVSRSVASIADVYVEAKNSPLTHKWNAAYQAARKLPADCVMMMGSDDWLSPSGFRLLCDTSLRDGAAGVRTMLVHDLVSQTTVLFPGYRIVASSPATKQTLGAGRTLRVDVLDSLGWRVFAASVAMDRGLDTPMDKFLRSHGVHVTVVPGEHLLDVKSDTNIYTYKHMATLFPGMVQRAVTTEVLDQAIGAGTMLRLQELRAARQSPNA